jgi:hypothetical protein
VRNIVFIVFAFLIVSCASVPDSVVQDRLKSASVAGILENEIIHTDAVGYTLMQLDKHNSQFKLGVYVLSPNKIYILNYSDNNGSLSKEIEVPLKYLDYVGLATTGAANHLQQLRLHVAGKAIVLNFASSSDNYAGYKERTGQAVSALRQQGVTVQAGAPFVMPGSFDEWILTVPLIINPG